MRLSLARRSERISSGWRSVSNTMTTGASGAVRISADSTLCFREDSCADHEARKPFALPAPMAVDPTDSASRMAPRERVVRVGAKTRAQSSARKWCHPVIRRYAAWAQRSDKTYTDPLTFAWDPQKAEENLRKHGVDFREAATVFDDSLSTTFPDDDHSSGERRFLIIGLSAFGRILVVSHTENGDKIRIISARAATRRERKFYEENESNPS